MTDAPPTRRTKPGHDLGARPHRWSILGQLTRTQQASSLSLYINVIVRVGGLLVKPVMVSPFKRTILRVGERDSRPIGRSLPVLVVRAGQEHTGDVREVRMQRSLNILYLRFQVDSPSPMSAGLGASSNSERSRRHEACREA